MYLQIEKSEADERPVNSKKKKAVSDGKNKQ